MSTFPEALGGTGLHGNGNRFAVTEGGTLKPVREHAGMTQTDRERGKQENILEEQSSAENKTAFCVILGWKIMRSKHFSSYVIFIFYVVVVFVGVTRLNFGDKIDPQS